MERTRRNSKETSSNTEEKGAKMEAVRVQKVASLSQSFDTIRPEYIRPENEQPGITTLHGTALEVPVINLSDPDAASIVRNISEASTEWGMFQVVSHGIPDEVIGELQRVGREFFELLQEEKELIAKVPGAESIEGYGTKLQKEVEGKKGWVDHLFHRIWPPSAINYQFWPKNPPSYREVNEEYANRLQPVANKMFKCLSLGLGLEPNAIKDALGGDDDLVYLMKINYYPPCPRPDLALGVVAHTDMSAITILVPNKVPGLQVSRDGRWYDVRYIPNALIVHIGDQIEILSNGKFKGVLYRTTVSKDRTRMSWPVFLEPDSEREIGPIGELIDEGNPAKYKTKKYKDYVYCKLNKIPQ